MMASDSTACLRRVDKGGVREFLGFRGAATAAAAADKAGGAILEIPDARALICGAPRCVQMRRTMGERNTGVETAFFTYFDE